MASTYTPIATYTGNGSSSTITFSSIPQTYTDLILVANAKNTTLQGYVYVRVGNGSVDTGTNYSRTYLSGNGSSASSARSSNDNVAYIIGNAYIDSVDQRFMSITHFQNYSNTTTYKTLLSRSNNANLGTDAVVNLWRSTSAINVITYENGQPFAVGSTFTLYGIKAA